MGNRGARDRALGRVAVILTRYRVDPSPKGRGALFSPSPWERGSGGGARTTPNLRRAMPLLLLASILLLSGCKAVPQIAGVVGGAVAGGASASPAVGFAVGVATATATGYAQRWYGRTREHAEQEVIAGTAGALPVGGEASWHINHLIPVGDEHGELLVTAAIPNVLTPCRRIVFSVVDGSGPKAKRSLYRADICQRASGWEWASTEPAVPRWGYLQ